jgi:hypothetical protein
MGPDQLTGRHHRLEQWLGSGRHRLVREAQDVAGEPSVVSPGPHDLLLADPALLALAQLEDVAALEADQFVHHIQVGRVGRDVHLGADGRAPAG